MRSLAVVVVAVLLAAVGATVGASAVAAPPKAPVRKLVHERFGAVLATPRRQALYYWNVEKRAGGKVRCKGACAKAWPPLIAASRRAVPKRIRGIAGRFGVVRRPDGRLQVTHRGLPVYTYAHERPGQVLCDDVDGWFVVRL